MSPKLVLATVSLAALSGVVAADDTDQLRLVSDRYLRNRDSFTQINCRFDWITGKTNDVAAVLAGGAVDEPTVMKGRWLVDGYLVYYELKSSTEQNQAPTGGQTTDRAVPPVENPAGYRQPSTPTRFSEQLLRNADYSLRYRDRIGNLFLQGDSRSYGIRVTPFNPDILGSDELSGPDVYIREGLAGRFPLRFGHDLVPGLDVWGVEVGTRQIFGFDPKRNFLLTYESSTRPDGQRHRTMTVTSARQCARDRWFPMRIVKIDSPDGPPPWRVEILEVTDLTVDEPCPRDELALELPAGTSVTVSRDKDVVSATTLKSSQRMHATELAALDRLSQPPPPPVVAPPAATAEHQWSLWLLVSGGVLLAIAAIAVRFPTQNT